MSDLSISLNRSTDPRLVIRRITGFRQDDLGEWVAELCCLHRQHIRHRPPQSEHPWVMTPEGRDERIGADLDCPLCDRAELPMGLRTTRTAGPFDGDDIPAGLRHAHRVPDATWGVLRVLEGSVGLSMETNPPLHLRIGAGEAQAIPPGVSHAVEVGGPVRLAVDFLAAT